MKHIRVSKHDMQLCGTENYTVVDEISKRKLKAKNHPLEDKFIYEKTMNSNVIESSYLQLDNNWKRINAKTDKSTVVLNQPFKCKKNMKIRSQKGTKYINGFAYKDSDEKPDIQANRNICGFEISCKDKTTAKKTAKPKRKKTASQFVNGITKNIVPIATVYKDNLFPSEKRYDSKILKLKCDSLDKSQCTSTLKTKVLLQPLENKLSLKYTINNKNNAMASYVDQLRTDFNILNAKENKVAAAKPKAKLRIHPLQNKFIFKPKIDRYDSNLLITNENEEKIVRPKAKLRIYSLQNKFNLKENIARDDSNLRNRSVNAVKAAKPKAKIVIPPFKKVILNEKIDRDDSNLLNTSKNKINAMEPKVNIVIHPLENKFMCKEKKGNGISEEIEEKSLHEQYFKHESRKINEIKKNRVAGDKKKTKKTSHPLEDKFIKEDNKGTENDKIIIKHSIFQLKNGKKYKIANAIKKDVQGESQIIKCTEKGNIHPLENKSLYKVHTGTEINDGTCKNSNFKYYPESKIKTLNNAKSNTAIKTNRTYKSKAKSCVHPLGKKFACRKNNTIHHVNKDMFTETKHDTECQSLPLFCEICDIQVSGYEPLLDHFVSANHNKNIQNPQLKDHIDFDEYNRRLKFLRKSLSSRQKNIYNCDFCPAFFRNIKQYHLHEKSGKHFNNINKSYQTVFAQSKEKIRSSRGI